MKKNLYAFLLLVLYGMNVWGQPNERVHVQTDKDFYLSGETMHLTVRTLGTDSSPLHMSKVVYVELLGNASNAVRMKIELDEGRGGAVITLPYMLSSGVYELVAYTRWMRNEGEQVFFRRPIGIYNSLSYSPETDKLVFEDGLPVQGEESSTGMTLRTDKPVYGNREKVSLSFPDFPKNASVSVSVVRQDVSLSAKDREAYAAISRNFDKKESVRFTPEMEGMIVEARYAGSSPDEKVLLPNLSIKGKEFHYYPGKDVGNGIYQFFTPTLSGMKEVVTGVETNGRMELISPFVATAPEALQPLHLDKNHEKLLLERSMAVQTGRFYPADSVVRKEVPGIFLPKPQFSYDLDDYRRFPTFAETFLEFIPWVSTARKGDGKAITIFDEMTGKSNHGNTLVMLDGVVIMNHESLLKYNPYFVKWVDIYVGKYVFANQMYEGIITFRTPNHWMPSFQLTENSLVQEYEGVLAQQTYLQPTWKKSTFPDFRHTLYWNPDVNPKDATLECWTSDLCGIYIVKAEGRTPDGQIIQGYTTFEVK